MDLNRIAFIGRTFREYIKLFNLTKEILQAGGILDCPAGASSFTTEAARMGYDVTAADILYGLPADKLIDKACADTAYALEKLYNIRDGYDWSFYKSPELHATERMKALANFSRDFPEGIKAGRYVPAKLPHLPFADDSFRLVLSSHFLFLYGDRLDFDVHMSCIREFLRVAPEMRIYPVMGLDGKEYPALDELIFALKSEGLLARRLKVPFTFIRGGNFMLRVTR
ncbi:MAG: class I SAM-dependent methyltransferase [Nitrospirota bacterium]